MPVKCCPVGQLVLHGRHDTPVTTSVLAACLPQAQHALFTALVNGPQEGCHAEPFEMPLHHLLSLYVLQVPYVSEKLAVSLHNAGTVDVASLSKYPEGHRHWPIDVAPAAAVPENGGHGSQV